LLPPGPTSSIAQFYRNCIDDKTVYIRLDDDIVFIEPEFFSRFLRFRLDHPEYFVVFPNIINNAVCTYLLAQRGTIKPGAWIHPWCMDVTAWGNPRFAEQLHRAFLDSVKTGELSRWYFGPRLLALSRYSINCMSWLGQEFAAFDGEVLGDEEEYLSVVKPSELGRINCIFGNAVVSHFAFRTQRAYLDSTSLLQSYCSLQSRGSEAVSADRSVLSDGDVWLPRLLDTIQAIRSAALVDLRSPQFVADQIRHAGLILDRRFLYGDDNRYMNTERVGLWQLPMQLARCLVQLGTYKINSVIDVGTASGWTIVVIAAYLSRFNSALIVDTLDVANLFSCYDTVKHLLHITFHLGQTAEDFRDQECDLAFIDADHTYDGCRRDYEMIGRSAKICAFHDVQDKYVSATPANNGGVPKFWQELKAATHPPDQVFEYLDHSHGDKVMGIGMVVTRRAATQPVGGDA
jgi:hypothetical protein